MLKGVLTFLIAIIISGNLLSSNADEVTGKWWTEDEGAIVEIYSRGNEYYGKLAWIEDPYNDDGTPVTDSENPDEDKRDRPLEGLEILKSFEYNGNQEWTNGEIYDPESGNTYSAKMRLEDGKLNVRGYYGISVLGRTQIWQPADQIPE